MRDAGTCHLDCHHCEPECHEGKGKAMIRDDSEKQTNFYEWKCHKQTQEKILITQNGKAQNPDNRKHQKTQNACHTCDFRIRRINGEIFPIRHVDGLADCVCQIHQSVGNTGFLFEKQKEIEKSCKKNREKIVIRFQRTPGKECE
ncbi:MAG: hypothetical protein K2O42_10430 [Oscillospiraceae bacterium]|nr:hypothetical protein [Oscillospiraceae bacterium]